MPYEDEGGYTAGRFGGLAHNTSFPVDCKQDRAVSHDSLPLRLRPDAILTDTTPISSPSTISSTSISPDRDDLVEISSASSYDSDNGPPEQHRNPRRTSIGATPPSLQRCDFKHRIFVEGLLAVTTSFVETIWPLARETPRSSTEFNGAGVLPLRTFIQETCRRSKTSYSTLQVALYYLVLLKEVLPDLDFTREQPRESNVADRLPSNPQVLPGQSGKPSECRVMQCGRRMFMSALMLAAKYLQDRNFSCKAWAKISGLSCLEINQNERVYLQNIEYRLHLKKEHFDNWSQIVVELCQSAKFQGSLDYLKIIRCLKPEMIHDSVNTKHFLNEIGEGRYHPGCSYQFGSFYRDNNDPGPKSMRIPLTSEFMQTPCKPTLRAELNVAGRHPIRPRDQAPCATTHSCPPPRPVYASSSTDLCPQFMQRPPDTKPLQPPLGDILHNLRTDLAIRYSIRSDDKIPGASNASYLTQPLRLRRNTRASKTLGEHTQSPVASPPSSPKSISSSSDSTLDSVFSDGAGMMSRSRSSSSSPALSFGSQRSFRYEVKAAPHPEPLRSSAIAGANDVDSGYESQAEMVVPEQPSHFNAIPEKSQAVAGRAKRKAPAAPTSSENNAAATLMMLSKSRVERSIISEAENKMLTGKRTPKKRGEPKPLKPGHTSEYAKAKRQKERASSRKDKTHHLALDAASPATSWSLGSTARESEEEKENQVGHKSWADTRKPVLTQDNPSKRRAQDAAGLAASMLRKELPRGIRLVI
jgi:hypothetical protein